MATEAAVSDRRNEPYFEGRLMAKQTDELTEGEWAVIQAVWAKEPCAAGDVQESLGAELGWGYSTVKTTMDRMVDKGLLSTERMRNLILYRSVITRAEAQSREVMGTIKRAFNGAMTPMMQFLVDSGELSSEQLDDLEAMIKNKKKKG